MPKKPKDLNDFQTESLSFLEANTPFNNVFPGSTIRSIADIMNGQMAQLSSEISDLSYNSFLGSAGGYYLDLFGDMFNLRRYYPEDLIISSGDKNIKFFTNGTTTLYRALGNNAIPEGTTITSANSEVTATVLESVGFSNTATTVFVSAKITRGTTNLNIGPNQLNAHSLDSTNLFVTNTGPIAYRGAIEDDNSYRSRIANFIVSLGGPNEARILSILQKLPDVARTEIRKGVSGSGSYDVFLIPTGNRVSQSTINLANRLLSDVSGFGVSYFIREPDYLPIKLEMQVKFNRDTPDNFVSNLLIRAENLVQALIGNVFPGEILYMSRIAAEVLNISDAIIDAKVVYLCINNKVRAVTDLRLENDEVLVPDENEINPIMVRQ